MRASTVKIIIFVSSFALLGLIFTQTFWIREEIMLSRKQFDHRADNALADVVEELRSPGDTMPRCTMQSLPGCAMGCNVTDIMAVIDTAKLSALMAKYINYHRLDGHYYYAIVKTSNDSAVYRSPQYPALNTASNPYKACLSCLWKNDYYHLALFFPQKNRVVFLKQVIWLGLTLAFLIIIIFGVTVIIITYLRQKKLSEMKNDFINNITHEFKTPVSTIALAAEVLMKAEPQKHHDRVSRYARIIYDENERMRKQVERVLEIAQQDHDEIKLNPVSFDLHELLNSMIPNICLEKSEKEVKVDYHLQSSNPVIEADIMYVSGIINNITENALKYTRGEPSLSVITADFAEGILLSFIDNGIGMSKESLTHVFDKFYRVPTGNVHNVKGFGLGLYYARQMAEAHNGFIKATSELNKGSRFDVYIPRIFNPKNIRNHE
jgi:two-component system phosphate regulon sensor histidine kinase PhoR